MRIRNPSLTRTCAPAAQCGGRGWRSPRLPRGRRRRCGGTGPAWRGWTAAGRRLPRGRSACRAPLRGPAPRRPSRTGFRRWSAALTATPSRWRPRGEARIRLVALRIDHGASSTQRRSCVAFPVVSLSVTWLCKHLSNPNIHHIHAVTVSPEGAQLNSLRGAQANGGGRARGTAYAVAAPQRGAACADKACPDPVQERGDVQTR